MNIETRLIEYGRSLLEPGQDDFLPSSSPWEQIREMQYNAGARAEGFIYEILDGVPCIPDGGLWEIVMVERMSRACDKSRRVAAVREALETIPAHHRQVLVATYCGELRERIPRDAEGAAQILRITKDEFYDRLAPALQWMEYKLCLTTKRAA